MTRIIYILFLMASFFHAGAQTFQDCISIDFESIIGQSSAEGLVISDQFQDTFGLSFSLENGGSPVVAEVGAPVTAFGSAFGSDTPAPNQGVGSFFLTDDGVLSGLNSPPIILDFESPVDSFSGCILDMDFGELFIIHTRDIDDQIIFRDTVFSSDPGTGDGISTCWGFNLDGCEGSVYSIRFEGQRTQAGQFGMGIDNLVFCLSGIDIANAVSFRTTEVLCDGTPGSIQIINSSNEDFLYSIDGGFTFQSDPVFEDLDIGSYTIIVNDINGCEAEIDNVVVSAEGFTSLPQVITRPACDFENGSIEVNANTIGISFSIDGIEFQESPFFENLDVGNYIVYLIDAAGCTLELPAEIVNEALLISDLNINDTNCNEPNGVIEVVPTFSNAVTYSIDGINFQDTLVFNDLPPGEYTVFIRDDRGCSDSQAADILPSEKVVLSALSTPDWCNNGNGSIALEASGGSGNFTFFIDGQDGSDNPLGASSATFVDLIADTYSANALDDTGCMAEELVSVLPGESIIVSEVQTNNPNCEDLFGSIVLNSGGGNGQVLFTINESITTASPFFDNLDAGDFSILITDAQGCQDSIQARLEYPVCPIYIPDAFSPEDNGRNDFFEVYTNSLYDVEILNFAIYDRWGNQMWENGGFTIHNANPTFYWDGTFRGKDLDSGVFVYKIEVRHINGETEFYKGDVTLVR